GNGITALKWAAWAAVLHKMPAVCHLHESSYEGYSTFQARKLAPCIERYSAISTDVKQQFIHRAGAPESQISLIFNGVHIDREVLKDEASRRETRLEFGIESDAPLVTMAARTDPLKGHAVLLDAIPKV